MQVFCCATIFVTVLSCCAARVRPWLRFTLTFTKTVRSYVFHHMHVGSRAADNLQTVEDEEAEAEAVAGVRPRLRLFYCPLLNAFIWHNSLKVCEGRV